jgi:DNA-binding transcriptional MocR family regulator
VLEVLTLEAADDDGALVTRTSARTLGRAVSVSKDTAAGALRLLADAGLIERRPQHRTGGRFGAGGYVLHLPPGLATVRNPTEPSPAPTPPPGRPRSRRRQPPSPQRHDQLTLLDDPEGPKP